MSSLGPSSRGSHLPNEGAARLLAIDACPLATADLVAALAGQGHDVAVLGDVGELRAALTVVRPDLVLCVAEGSAEALALLAELDGAASPRPAAIVVTARALGDAEAAVLLGGGADDVVALPADRPGELRARVLGWLRHQAALQALRRVRTEREALRHEANTDPMTGAWNRRALEASLERRLAADEAFGVLFVDVDHFKRVNDEHGHDVGDAVLVGLARLLAAALRAHDVVARLGGEEFVILMSHVDAASAFSGAERLRRLIATEWASLGLPPITVSIGVATRAPGDPADADELVRRGDAAVYEAKRCGRDRVVAHHDDLPVARTSARRASGARPIAVPVSPTLPPAARAT